MYNPALPNHYRDVVFTAYVRRRQREEADALEQQRQPNALASALSSLVSTLPACADGETVSSSGLSLSAEELHLHRIKESAALGIQSAVDMEKDALEVEHRKKKLEGADARSRIGSRLDKLKALAAKSKKLTGSDAAEKTHAMPMPSTNTTTAPTTTTSAEPASSSSLPSAPSATAPLVFQRSALAAGGYVMTAAPVDSSVLSATAGVATSTKRAVRGKPSSTLLLRYLRESPVATTWSAEQVAQAAASPTARDALCAPLVDSVRQRCRRFGFVRGVKARVHTAAAVASVLGVAAMDSAALRCEQLRLWVRYDSVTEAFKAAESLAKEPATAEGPVFCVCFYVTNLFDADTLDLRAEDDRVLS
ncbi:hypothetical protein ABB37_07227 [Leptomonas pyrrhocoris]|uniref:Uncharacterized protein n=1 Tax=Leptomonas pyrrhocoris TaxID=157538 RepID=A0A0M9FWI9_LEPPY|nr:hypothetical protein ABB37_07227 [Leptomonas pyrrhocoris]XP_015655786.1 hypothetical protein ABB37_07227 [Leptomonas pyrrhocoris]XP_015655787.1 hypothetical protein ABB37_07227 [Leptomonas pyrrhocoris]KPA77346.1 hypothetical protein ABB37_07227 [Leptomonas pyrrhocoris]KPA77347.1 hypothetical protein ABB37_07227 [Leptomonas pyrrhocoris]KPA77348.1 hypothetical protein ABB37_07227 [Leptomonas pyrrhocoris]|eukprot:XP_015655785.1 hypothetical protein ABB37_07227 [Leptomonas pyrrhocoris]